MKLLQSLHSSRPLVSAALFMAATLALVLISSACGTNRPSSAIITPTLTVTATFPPTLTPTPIPLGNPDNPFVIGLVSETGDPQISAAADEFALQLSNLAQVSIRGTVYSSYDLLMDDLSYGKVHITWLPPLTYLYASQRDLAEVILLTNHFGVYQYGTQFLANVESNFTPYYDPVSGYNSADAATALSQFQGLRPCWVEPQSPSGYIVPAGLIKTINVETLPPVIVQSHTAVIRALYIKGICDFGATFSISGDPRTASAVQQDLPDSTNRIFIIWRSDPIIPNLNLSFATGITEGNRQALTTALLDLAITPEGKGLLSLSAGNYQIDDVRAINDDVYQPLRVIVEALDLDLKEMIGK